jgi:hypothetical protein
MIGAVEISNTTSARRSFCEQSVERRSTLDRARLLQAEWLEVNAPMPEYLISAVQYDLDHARIQKVRVRTMSRDGVGAAIELTRDQLVTAIEFGSNFVRLRGAPQAQRIEPAPVRLVQLGRCAYLRCDTCPWPLDELTGIPEY